MRPANESDARKIIDYLKQSFYDCLYMYIDIRTCGVWNDNIQVWIDDNASGELDFVMMRYYDSIQVYFDDIHSVDEVITKIKDLKPKMISGNRRNIELLSPYFSEYKPSYGEIFELTVAVSYDKSEVVKTATLNDVEKIAELICSDSNIGAHYEVAGLARQLADRITSGTGRSLIIEKDGRIIAHNATYAEMDDVAIVGGTIVDPAYRGGPWFWVIGNELIKRLCDEGKKVYSFAATQKMIKYHTLKHKKCGDYGKLELLRK